MTPIREGDEVWVFERWRRGSHEDPPVPGTVVKVGRALVTIRYQGGGDGVFRLDTGHLNDKNYGSQTYFLTPAQAQAREREKAAVAVLKDAGFEVRLGHRPPGALIEALAKVARDFPEED